MNGEPKKLPVREFNKQEIIDIINEALKTGEVKVPVGVDLDHLDPNECVQLNGDNIDGYLPVMLDDTISEEQFQKLKLLLKKAVKQGFVLRDDDILILNYVYKDNTSFVACFGCLYSHEYQGSHYEIQLTVEEDSFKVKAAYSEL